MLRSHGRTGWVIGMVAALALTVSPSAFAQKDLIHPEDTRDALRALSVSLDRLAPGAADLGRTEGARRSLERLDYAQLEVLHQVMQDRPELVAAMERVNTAASQLNDEIGFMPGDPAIGTLADPVYSTLCGSTRVDAQTASDQLDLWEMLQTAAVQAQGACDAATSGDTMQDNVTACPAAATANEMALAARFAYEASLLCLRDVDGAEIAATLASVNEVGAAVGSLGDDFNDALTTLGDTLQSEHADILAAIQATQDLVTAESAAVRQAIADLGLAIDAQFQTVFANQQLILDNQATLLDNQATILQLLVTPQGRRPGWNGRVPNDTSGNGNGNNGNGNGNQP